MVVSRDRVVIISLEDRGVDRYGKWSIVWSYFVGRSLRIMEISILFIIWMLAFEVYV
jgi:hypothetical protein